MFHETIARKHFGTEPWSLLVGLSAIAALVGIVIGQEKWLYLPAFAMLPLLYFWPVEFSLGCLALLVPFEQIALLSERAVASLALVLVVGVLGCVGLLGSRLQSFPNTTKWWLVFMAWTMASTLWAVAPRESLATLHLVVMFLIFYIAASIFRITEKELNFVVNVSILAGGAASVLSIYEFYSGMIIASHQVRATLVAGDVEGNPNRFAIRLLLPLAFAIARVVSARNWWSRAIALFFMALIGWALLLAMSRGTLLAATVVILVFVLRNKFFRRRTVLIVLTAVVLAAAMPEGLLIRIERSRKDRGAGRLDIWAVGLTAFEHYPIIGAGYGNFQTVFTEFAGSASHFTRIRSDAHNIYLATAVEGGIVGLFLLLLAIKRQLSSAARCEKQANATWILLVACEAGFCGVLVAGFFGTIIWDKTFWLALGCLALATTLQSSKIASHLPALSYHEAA